MEALTLINKATILQEESPFQQTGKSRAAGPSIDVNRDPGSEELVA
jgi:hypothetical protein